MDLKSNNRTCREMTPKEKEFEARLLAYYTPDRIRRMALSHKAAEDLKDMMGGRTKNSPEEKKARKRRNSLRKKRASRRG